MSKLVAYLSYRDVNAAITWLEALGFETTTRQRDDGGATVHAESRLGDAVVMVARAQIGRPAQPDQKGTGGLDGPGLSTPLRARPAPDAREQDLPDWRVRVKMAAYGDRRTGRRGERRRWGG
jgi:hypothetical protein